MELNLVKNLVKKLERSDDLRVRMIMDYHRGQRENIKSPIREMSSYEFFHNIAMANVNADIQVGMLNCSSTDMGSLQKLLYKFSGQFREATGVHHAKFAVFDDSVILTGANFESQYFLDRKDRYWIINKCPELANYLENYSLNLLGACKKIGWDGEVYGVSDVGGKGKKSSSGIGEEKSFLSKMFNPNRTHNQQVVDLEDTGSSMAAPIGVEGLKRKTKNMVSVFNFLNFRKVEAQKYEMEEKMLGDGGRGNMEKLEGNQDIQNAITAFKSQDIKTETLNKLKDAENDTEVNKIINGLKFDPFLEFDEDGKDNGEMVYLMPMLQFPKIGVQSDYDFTVDLLYWLSKKNNTRLIDGPLEGQKKGDVVFEGRTDEVKEFHLVSGYLNPPYDMVYALCDIKAEKMSFIGAAPEANSFYNAPFPKYLIPLFYHSCMNKLKEKIISKRQEGDLDSVKFFEYFPEMDKPFKAKTFHSKGLFVKTQNDEFGSYLGTIGSGNFGERSYFRDNELNFWVYSKNPKFWSLLEGERKKIIEGCREVGEVKQKDTGGIKGIVFNWLMKSLKMG